MSNKRTMWIGLGIAIVLSVPAPASAQSKCDAGRLKAYGKRVACLAGVDAKAAKTGTAADAEKAAKCAEGFDKKCGKAELLGDCTTKVNACSALLVESDTCRTASAGFCSASGGTEVGGACWLLGILGESCTQTCSAVGLVYDSATELYAGSGGTDANCEAVLDALQVADYNFAAGPCVPFAVGCAQQPSVPQRVRCTTPTTTESGSATGVGRACACQEP